MRVLLVAHRYPPDDFGGVECYTQRQAQELARAGDQVSVVARRWQVLPTQVQLLREQTPEGIPVYRFAGGVHNLDRFYLDHFLLKYDEVEEQFTAVVQEERPEVVHINHLAGQSPRFIEIAQRHGAAVVLSLHDLYFACPLVHLQKTSGELCAGPDGGRECARTCFAAEGAGAALRWGLRYNYFRRWLGMAQRVVCYSRYVGSYFEKFGVDPARLRIVPNGVSFAVDPRLLAATTPSQRDGMMRLAYCGTVARHKGPHVILDALKVANLGAVDLVVIGQFDDRVYVRQLREQAAGIPGLRFRMYGPYNRPELPFLLKDIDCVVVPSLVPEAGPIVPREALALGIPILVARLGALPELVTDGDNGFTYDPHQPGELAGLLLRLKWDDQLLGHLRQGARKSQVGTVAGHNAAIREVHQEAVAELQRQGPPRSSELAELEFLHNALLQMGFGSSAADDEAQPTEVVAGAPA